jgi:hypothetical protein
MPECPFGKVFTRFNGAAFAWRLCYNLIFWHFYDIGLFARIDILRFSLIYTPPYNLFHTFYLFTISAVPFRIYTFFNQKRLYNTLHSL